MNRHVQNAALIRSSPKGEPRAVTPHIRPCRMRGASLIELVLVIVIVGIVGSLGAALMKSGFDAYLKERDISGAAWQGRFAMARLNQDLRNVRSATTGDLTMTPANQISFVTTSGASVTYTVSGTTLMRNGQPLADGISGLSFTYIANDGKTTAASVTQVYYITASFTVVQGGANLNWRTVIHPRSF